MKEDECGFIYPVIDEDKCIRCGLCKKACAFQNIEENNIPIECFAAISKNPEQAKQSASAGIFAAIATRVIEDGGIVYGAAFDGNWNVRHTSAETMDELVVLQGSKYVHSDIKRTYTDVRKQLELNREVLFSGTPCQVAGLKGYLGKDYKNLTTIDIVCHGVPSNRMFQDYIHTIEDKYGGKTTFFSFRDKSLGWGKNGRAVVNGKSIKIWQSASAYLYYFGRSFLYRDSCYRCVYASSHRPADITLGDYWGIEKQHPEWLDNKDWDESNGISLVIINTPKGICMMPVLQDVAYLKKSTFEAIAAGNEQLRHPTVANGRGMIFKLYKEKGWKALNEQFLKTNVIKRYSSQIKAILPQRMKRFLKRYI